jgi:hypothetical protein
VTTAALSLLTTWIRKFNAKRMCASCQLKLEGVVQSCLGGILIQLLEAASSLLMVVVEEMEITS